MNDGRDILTPELAQRVKNLLGEMGITMPDPAMFARIARRWGVAMVDPSRERSWIDERVYQGVLLRGHHWQDLAEARAPVPMILHCPACGAQHVDAPEPETGWLNPPHRSHLCAGCGAIWRAADIPTTGVPAIATRGSVDTWPVPEEKEEA